MTSFPISEFSAATHQAILPASADVVVVGGGIIGVMSAWFLAERGQTVVLLEKGRIAGEQSSRNWGWVRQQGRDPAELPIMIEAAALWPKLAAECDLDIGLRHTGVLYLAGDEAELGRYEGWMQHARAHDLDTRILSSAEVAALIPSAARRWPGAIWTASDSRVEPWLAVPALARAAERKGVIIREDCAVRGFDIAAGRIAGVVTESGRVAASQVVLAGGAWSSLLLRRHGIAIPQLSVRTPVAATGPMPEVFAGAAADAKIAFRRRLDGGYTLAPADFHELFIGPDAFRNLRSFLPQLRANPLGTRYFPASPKGYPDAWGIDRRWSMDRPGPFEAVRVLNPAPNRAQIARLVREFAQVFPDLGAPEIRLAWGGMIDTMPDIVPVIGRAATLPGLTIATGMSGHGFGIGPGIGRVVADLVTGRAVGHDLSRFRLSRFSDGTKLTPGPSL